VTTSTPVSESHTLSSTRRAPFVIEVSATRRRLCNSCRPGL